MNGHRDPMPDGAEDLRDRFEGAAPVIVVDPEPVVRRGRRRRAATRAGGALGALAVVAVVVVLITRPSGEGPAPATTSPPPVEPTRPVAIQMVPGVVAPGDVVTAVLVASEENDLTFGVAAEIERWDGDEWRRAGVVGLCLAEWECVGTVTDRLGGVEDIGLGASPGSLGPATVFSTDGLADGWYRLVQRAALDAGVAAGVFEVRTGAMAAPPQPAQDGVRLTVDPVLVPPEGGLVRVVTQVPAGPDGTLTAEDIEAVDVSLDPNALVARWDGEEWLHVLEVYVQAREPDLGVEWGSPVVLPPLGDGSYRLLRTRADEPAVWGVFTVVEGAPALQQPEPDDGTAPDPEPDPEPDPDADAEDLFAPDHPDCQASPGRCLLEAWWRDVVAEAGIDRAGGEHDLGLVLTDTVRMAGQRHLALTLFPAEAAPPGTTELTVETTTQIGDAQVEAGRWDDGADGRRVSCGGFVLQSSSTALEPDEIDHVIGLLADALQDCPADVDALAARYPQYPPIP